MTRKINTVIFDMDGVIFDTENLCLKSWIYASDGQYPDIEAAFRSIIGTNYRRTMEILALRYGPDFPYEAFREKAREYFYGYERKYGMPLKPGVYQLMDWLKAEGYCIALASSTDRVNVERELSEAGLIGYFESLTCGDSVKRSKPEPDIYIEACRSVSRRPEDCYAVEDSINGVLSASRAGLRPIMVPDLLQPDEATEKLLAGKCAGLLEVIDFLKRQES